MIDESFGESNSQSTHVSMSTKRNDNGKCIKKKIINDYSSIVNELNLV